MLVAALRAHAVHERDAAERAAIFRRARREFARRHIDAARERDLHDIELVLEEGVDHLDHAFHGHRLLRDDETAVGISLAKLVLERGAFHRVRGRAVLDAFLLVDAENRRQERIVLALLSSAAKCAYEHGLTGFEFASGIPGTVGGGVVMNAGAYDGEMKQIVESVRVLSNDGEIFTLDNDTMEFGYRTSIIKNRHFTVLEVTLKLKEGNREEIRKKMDELNAKRREKQPLEFPSAGSTFKRPEGYFAGKLIMDTGLRGFSVGGAKVSEKHCGFVVNTGKASATDVADVIAEVQEKVKNKFGVSLEREIIYLGDF